MRRREYTGSGRGENDICGRGRDRETERPRDRERERERAAAPSSLKGLKRGFDGRQRGRLRKAKLATGGKGGESGEADIEQKNGMERRNWMWCRVERGIVARSSA